jgi:hypothetical protein
VPELRNAARGSFGLAEALVLWVLFALVAVATAITYTRTPVRELYHVSRGGPAAGARAVLGFAGFPTALMALAVLPLVIDRLPRRIVLAAALLAAGLAATTFLPGALGDDRIDARPPNVFAAVGVVLALILAIVAARTVGTGRPWRREPGDRARVLLGAVLLFCALPWIAATLDLSLHMPVLRSLFLTDQLRSQPGAAGVHQAVHAGFHHGLAGVMLALTALLLSRALPYLRRPWLRQILALYLSFLLAYGLANGVQDFQLEQIVKRGLTTYELPMVLIPTLSWAWAVLLAFAAAIYMLAFRPLARGGHDRPEARTALGRPARRGDAIQRDREDLPDDPHRDSNAEPAEQHGPEQRLAGQRIHMPAEKQLPI